MKRFWCFVESSNVLTHCTGDASHPPPACSGLDFIFQCGPKGFVPSLILINRLACLLVYSLAIAASLVAPKKNVVVVVVDDLGATLVVTATGP